MSCCLAASPLAARVSPPPEKGLSVLSRFVKAKPVFTPKKVFLFIDLHKLVWKQHNTVSVCLRFQTGHAVEMYADYGRIFADVIVHILPH